jgi:hypothetical protein
VLPIDQCFSYYRRRAARRSIAAPRHWLTTLAMLPEGNGSKFDAINPACVEFSDA